MWHLLRQVDTTIMFITFVVLDSLSRFLVGLLDLIEDLLELVQVETAPFLQLEMVSFR